jgi:hypothetical protein
MTKNKTFVLLLSLLSLAAAGSVQARTVEDFTSSTVGKFPNSFKTYPFQRSKAEGVYIVQEEGGNKFLYAKDDKDVSVQTLKKFSWDAIKEPNFSWKWRAITLPKGAAENSKLTNDSACGVYVLFGGYGGKVLKYVWSSTLPVGSTYEKKANEFFFIVSESGSSKVGSWQTESVNVIEDYKKVFKEDPTKKTEGFAVLTDGNATHSPAECHYDDFAVSE